MNKGQTLLMVVMWAGGISLSVAGIASTAVMSKFAKQDEIIFGNTKEITAIKTELPYIKANIDRVESKIDALLINQGIDPKKLK
jgi:peptidoglycan hydrolase CwlO-like protein